MSQDDSSPDIIGPFSVDPRRLHQLLRGVGLNSVIGRLDSVQRETDKAANEAKAAVAGAMLFEYGGLCTRASSNDDLLKSPDAEPDVEITAKGYALHSMAKRLAEMIADFVDEGVQSQEYRAQAHEHTAQAERWAARMSKAVNLAERVRAAEASVTERQN